MTQNKDREEKSRCGIVVWLLMPLGEFIGTVTFNFPHCEPIFCGWAFLRAHFHDSDVSRMTERHSYWTKTKTKKQPLSES